MDTNHESVSLPRHTGLRGRVDTLKSRGLSKLHDVQQTLQDRRTHLQDGAVRKISDAQESMRSNPMKWAGIAAAGGLGLGLISRMARARKKHEPFLVVIESAC